MIQSKKIDRYNDDFYLNWDNTQTGSDLFDNSNIAKANDWAISFFDIRDNNGTGASFKQSIVGNKIGIASGLSVSSKVSSGNYALEVSVFDGSETIYTLLSDATLDSAIRIYNIVLSYETATSILSFYLNGVFYDSVSLSARSEWSNTSFVKIGSLGDTSSFNKIGGVRDLVFYDRIPTIQEIQYAYKTSIQSVSIYDDILHYYPLNQVPILKEPYNITRLDWNNITGVWDSWIFYTDPLVGDGNVEWTGKVTAISALGFTTSLGGFIPIGNTLRTAIEYGIQFIPTNYRFIESGTLSTSVPNTVDRLYKIERIGSTINYYVDNVLVKTTLGATTSDLRVLLICQGNDQYLGVNIANDIKLNGVNITSYTERKYLDYEFFNKDVANLYNPLTTASDVELLGWTADELGLGVGGLPSSTTYIGWESKTNYIPTIEYNKGLNMLTSQSLTINGLTIGDKLVVNYDELGISKQEIIDVNAINYTY